MSTLIALQPCSLAALSLSLLRFLFSVNIHRCLETRVLKTRRAVCVRSGQEQHRPQAAVTTLSDQGQHQAPGAGEQIVAVQGSLSPTKQDEAGFPVPVTYCSVRFKSVGSGQLCHQGYGYNLCKYISEFIYEGSLLTPAGSQTA